jgi:ribosome biogenesis GTPase
MDLDEDDVRIRPNPRGSRPRSRLRPSHDDAAQGFVMAVDRGRFSCLVGGRDGAGPEVVAIKARELGRKGVVVGDQVALVGDLGGGVDALARIVRVLPRGSVLRRSADDTDPVERVLVANASQLVIVTALADPQPRLGFIDRCLVAAYDGGLAPLLCLTKADLADPESLLEIYRPLGVPYTITSRGAERGGDGLRARLAGHISVLIGQSGVGKSTLVNALVPDADRAIGRVNEVTGRGRHTSSSAIALRLPDHAGWVIDTPGVRGFGLAHVDPAQIVAAFPDLEAGTADCPRGCTHEENAPECALDAYVADGHVDPARLASFRRLLAARLSGQ